MRVLVVDDEPEILFLVKANIEMLGHTCDEADSAEACDRAISENPPDALVLDVAMPGVDGPTLLARLRARGTEPPRVLLLSAILPEELAALADDLGVDWLSKPFSVGQFRAALERLVGAPA